jgi:hypothetical protein
MKCFHCLLSPDREDPIYIGINRLVAKGAIVQDITNDDSNTTTPQHICPIGEGHQKRIIQRYFEIVEDYTQERRRLTKITELEKPLHYG